MADAGPTVGGAALTESQLTGIVGEAIRRWSTSELAAASPSRWTV